MSPVSLYLMKGSLALLNSKFISYSYASAINVSMYKYGMHREDILKANIGHDFSPNNLLKNPIL